MVGQLLSILVEEKQLSSQVVIRYDDVILGRSCRRL